MTTIETLAGELDRMDRQYTDLLVVLSRIRSGEIDPGQVEVDLRGRSWRLLDPPIGRSHLSVPLELVEALAGADAGD